MAEKKTAAGRTPIPEGYKPVTSGNFPAVHDFEKEPVLQGVVADVRKVTLKQGRKVKETRVMEVTDTATGEQTSVWESAALESLFDEAKKGDEIFIRYDGPIQIKGRTMPMKGFTTALKAKAAK